MARDPGLEELITAALGDQRGVTGKAMFGGWAFLLHGNLLCGVRAGSMMLRVGRDSEPWALSIPGVVPVEMRGHRMQGYVRAAPEAYGNDSVRQQLIDAAVAFTLSLQGNGPSRSAASSKRTPAAKKQAAKPMGRKR